MPYGTTAVGMAPWGFRGQGRPPLSPVRQSVQDLALSCESSPGKVVLPSSSIDPVTGMPKHDINVHCNPLFTEPLTAQQSGAARTHGTGDVAHHHVHPGQGCEPASLAHTEGIGQQRDVPASPPSELQQSLRALLQQHTQKMEVSVAGRPLSHIWLSVESQLSRLLEQVWYLQALRECASKVRRVCDN